MALAKAYRKVTQKELILEHLMAGHSITPLEALSNYGAYRLGAVIFELRKEGYDITTRIKRDPTGRNYARYTLNKKAKKG